MSTVAIFHPVLGVREGERSLADLLERAGHRTRIVDLLGGRVYDDYEEAGGHLFTDPTLPAEHSAAATELAHRRVLAFLDDLGD